MIQCREKNTPKIKHVLIVMAFFIFFLAIPIAYCLVSYSANIVIIPQARSFASASIIYRSNTGTNFLDSPKERTWNGLTWSDPETELVTAESNVLLVRSVYCPLPSRLEERIVVTLSVDDYLDVYVWNGSNWGVINNLGKVNSGAASFQSFDIAYEKASGDAILVYALLSSDGTKDLGFRTWDGLAWSNEVYIDDVGHSSSINYRWVELESNPCSGSNEIALIAVDQSNADCNGWIWNGFEWGSFQELENSMSAVRDCECIGVVYEQQSGQAMFAWCYSGFLESRKWNGAAWENELPAISISTLNTRWLSLKADPASDCLMATVIDGQNDLNTILWNGSIWASPVEHDDAVTNVDKRCADFDWESSGSGGLLVWSASVGSISYKSFYVSINWGNEFSIANPAAHPWVQLKRNPAYVSGDVMVLGATVNGDQDIFGLRWNGLALTIEAVAFTSDASTIAYECFDIGFKLNFNT